MRPAIFIAHTSAESADIFMPAMRNNFAVGKAVIQAILNGEPNS